MITIPFPSSGTANILDNNYYEILDDSYVVLPVDQESNSTFSKKGAKLIPISCKLSDIESSVPIPYQLINFTTGTSIRAWSNIIKKRNGYELICWTSSEIITIDLGSRGAGILKTNKLGELADLPQVILMTIFKIAKINFNHNLKDHGIKKALKNSKEYHATKG